MDPRGSNVALTQSEYALLKVFLEDPRRSLTREYLIRATRITGDVLDRSIDVRILRPRRKLSAVASGESIVSTEQETGYGFATPAKRHPLHPADFKRARPPTLSRVTEGRVVPAATHRQEPFVRPARPERTPTCEARLFRTFRSDWRVEYSARSTVPSCSGRQRAARCPNARSPCRRRPSCRCRRRQSRCHSDRR
jgi:DNA-binding winged helix-turn-helix (wHTH) protein